jgi:hypothetical protein
MLKKEQGVRMNKYIIILFFVSILLLLTACGGEYVSDNPKITYPESVFDKAKFGGNKFN